VLDGETDCPQREVTPSAGSQSRIEALTLKAFRVVTLLASMGEEPSAPVILSAFKEYRMLAAIESDLQGLLYWWQRYQEIPRSLEDAARGFWHLVALVNHSDILFTGKRGTDPVEGAIFRGFRDLGVPELGDTFRRAPQDGVDDVLRHDGRCCRARQIHCDRTNACWAAIRKRRGKPHAD
jgi:hypothetical protein